MGTFVSIEVSGVKYNTNSSLSHKNFCNCPCQTLFKGHNVLLYHLQHLRKAPLKFILGAIARKGGVGGSQSLPGWFGATFLGKNLLDFGGVSTLARMVWGTFFAKIKWAFAWFQGQSKPLPGWFGALMQWKLKFFFYQYLLGWSVLIVQHQDI